VNDDELVSTVAHQVKTPLAVIRGYAELLGARDDDATRLEAAARITEATNVLDFMVDDLVVVFALEAGLITLEPEAVDLAQAAEDSIRRLEGRFARHTFVTSFEGVSPAWADADHLDRIFATLLLNACRLSPDGGEVLVDGRSEADVVTVAISDSGPGVSEEELAVAFERDRPPTAVDHSDVRSSGLELYKVRRLVELHGGSVKAESGPGRGSTFRFSLPR
jgi:signal transduction histidine kinase